MLNRLSQRNILQQRIESGSFSAPARWTKTIENVDFDFPRLTIEDLRFLFFGTYKIKIAKSYFEEHQEPDGDYMIELGDTDDNILRCRIQSRHSNATKHKAWIQYSMTGDPIVAWYCTYPAGAITVGCCLHVASIIWYLSYGPNIDYKQSTAQRRLCQTILERTFESQDSDDSDIDNSEY